MNLNLLIVEDSVSYAIELEQIAEEIGFNVVGVVDNSADALEAVFSESPDLILMDISIKGKLDGIDIANRIQHLNIPILFITSFNDEETYQRASQSNTIGYIVKPVDKITMASSLKLLIKNNILKSTDDRSGIAEVANNEYIFFMKNNIYHKVDIRKILFIASKDNYCSFMLEDNTEFLIRISLSEVEELLAEKNFVRCHRQYIVNQRKMESMNTSKCTIKVSNYEIPYSRSKKADIMSIGVFLK